MNNYTFLELWNITQEFLDDDRPYYIYVKNHTEMTFGLGMVSSTETENLIRGVLFFGLWVNNATVISKEFSIEIVIQMLTGVFIDAIWEFTSRSKFNMYKIKLDDLNKKITSLSSTNTSDISNKFYENNNIKDTSGNWNSPQFLNSSTKSENNVAVDGKTETTGELAKYLYELQQVNLDIANLRKEVVMKTVSVLSYPFTIDDEYDNHIPEIWKYD